MKEPVIFFGSGPVAAKSLELLHKNFSIEAVITKPKPTNHKHPVPVLDFANKLKLPVYTAENKNQLDEIFKSTLFASRVGIVVDFGIIISQSVIDYFPLGIINSHFSLLPQLRGADPITFAILSGVKKTGVSLMIIDEALDTGKLIAQKSLPISPTETSMSLTERLIKLSNDLLIEKLPLYVGGQIKPKNQPHPDRATYTRKLTKSDGTIDWSKSAEEIEGEIRAFLEWPKSSTKIAGKEVIVTEAEVSEESGTKGDFKVINKQLLAFCGRGSLKINKLKPAGKNEMTAQEFLAGYGKDI